MGVRNQSQGPSSLELLIGGDSYKGQYVPPLMAEVMKEAQAEAAAAKRAAQRAAVKETATPSTDAFTGTKKAATPAAPKALPPETEARLDAIAQAPDLEAALKQAATMPELVTAAEQKLNVQLYADLVPDRAAKAAQAGAWTVMFPSEGNAKYFGTDRSLIAAPHLLKKGAVTFALVQKDLYGTADMRSNSYGIAASEKVSRVRPGLGRFLPWSTGADGVQKALPGLTPQTLAASIRDALRAG
jgi:hypothetical protein